ncbi:MAG: peroxide stress protein YaaA [Flavobacteriales bacterium]|nr:peroxide stress protein YaaA [Flavobacteriales bacterium]
MLALLSPAKDLSKEAPPTYEGATQPVLLEDCALLVAKMKSLSAKKLAKLMDLSPALGELNRQRYEEWSTPFTKTNARPAIFTFNGEVYRGLKARAFDRSDLQFAQHHLRILSGLYGVLRPLDLMQDYRLMMGTGLSVGRKKNLYAFWGDRITDVLKADLTRSGSNTVINLASTEYFKAVNTERLGARIITPVFKDRRPGGYKMVMVFAKQQRGAMARAIIQQRILDPEKLKAYAGDGYRFAPEESTEGEWVYLRERKP